MRNLWGKECIEQGAPGCADFVIFPSSVIFCTATMLVIYLHECKLDQTHFEGVNSIATRVDSVHEMHGWVENETGGGERMWLSRRGGRFVSPTDERASRVPAAVPDVSALTIKPSKPTIKPTAKGLLIITKMSPTPSQRCPPRINRTRSTRSPPHTSNL